MGCFNVGARIENASSRSRVAVVPKLLVDTGSEYTWIGGSTLENIGVKIGVENIGIVHWSNIGG